MIGETLGAYRIVEQIGAGGMATVYKAYHAAMDRYVAVKVLPAHFAQDETFVKRFEREARMIARLEHPNILPVYDFGEQGGTTYLVMRYLDVGTLSDYLTEHAPLSLEQTSRFLTQIASALDYAHELDIIHRDIKPANVLIDRHGSAFISDFGVSKMVGGSEGVTDLTGGGMIGTPSYMAPEQVAGHPAVPASDQYALGVVLYKMVTGEVPFQAETPAAVLLMHINAPLPLPSTVRPGLPDEVERVVLKALAKDPADRYSSCRELAEAFERAISGLPEAVVQQPGGVDDAVAQTKERMPDLMDPRTLPAATRPGEAVPDLGEKPTRRLRPAVAVGGIALLAIAAVVAGVVLKGMSQPTTPVTLDIPESGALVEPCAWRGGGESTELCVMNMANYFVIERLLVDENVGEVISASWSPDGSQIAFSVIPPGGRPDRDTSIFVVNTDGTGLREVPTPYNTIDTAWSPNGEWIAVHASGALGFVAPDGADVRLIQPTQSGVCNDWPQWSPDSQYVVVVTGDCLDEKRIVAVLDLQGNTVATFGEVKTGEPLPVVFSPDGTQVAYLKPDGQPVIVDLDGDGTERSLSTWPVWWSSSVYPQWSGSVDVIIEEP